MMHFFEVYKALEHKVTTVHEVLPKKEAKAVIKKYIEKYKESYL
jgi:inorganic pyrophosphatase